MLETIDSYIYIGVSFSTFKFDEVSLLCLKYGLSKFRKKKYFNKIKEELSKTKYSFVNDSIISYYIHSTLLSLSNSSLIISPSKKEIKLSSKYLRRDVAYSSSFKIIDLSLEIKKRNACFILEKKDDIKRYKFLISDFLNHKVIIIEDIIKEISEKTNSETIFDEIKLKILQDNDSEVYFLDIDIFSNLISDFVFNLNKIAIIL
ncbi:MAG: hypothetical protein SOW55_00930 [Bacilli bacterium]|nr:hypothetical protein [Bacillales bacterium]MDY2574540.1 hypothetical protein [Bacilli bacterium]